MANRTAKDANTVKGTNPQYLIEKIIRMRIYDSRYWKEECFALSAELLVDRGMELRFVGGIYGGNVKPTPFLCLILKLLQIQPDKDIVIEFIRQEDSKYVRALGALYFRLIGTSAEIYKYLEPLYNDYRKLRFMARSGTFEVLHMDEFIDQLLRESTVCDVQLPRLQKRDILEANAQLDKRKSALEEDLENVSASSSEDSGDEAAAKKSSTKGFRDKARKAASPPTTTYPRRPSRSPPERRRRSKERHGRRSRSKSRERTSRRSPDRSGGGRSRYPDRDHREKERGKDRGGGGGSSKRTREDSYEREIREANELRQKLGLAPLQQ